MQINHIVKSKNSKNTESAQLCINVHTQQWEMHAGSPEGSYAGLKGINWTQVLPRIPLQRCTQKAQRFTTRGSVFSQG